MTTRAEALGIALEEALTQLAEAEEARHAVDIARHRAAVQILRAALAQPAKESTS